MFKHSKLILVSVILLLVIAGLFSSLTKVVKAGSLTSSAVTLSNTRMSYKATVGAGTTAGSSAITITAAGPDLNTNHLFPGDTVCFTDAGQNGCIGATTYTVDSIADTTHFNLSAPLGTDTAAVGGYVVATQSATWTISVVTQNTVPIGGSLMVTIPAADGGDAHNTSANRFPDTGSGVSTSGFDMGGIISSNISIGQTGGTAATWSTAVITIGGGTANTTDHTIIFTRSTNTVGAGVTLTITIGGITSTNGIVNPAPITGHTQGNADIYGVTVSTRDAGSNLIDTSIPRVAPVEGVLISGTVDESLSFVVSGVGTGQSTGCGNTTSITTTATSVPWGHFAATSTFYYASQNLTVSTNAASGYAVTIEESDQMGRNGNTCTGTSPSTGDYTFGGSNYCIRDTTCSAATPCTYTVMGDWTGATLYGLGYSLATTGGTTAASFFYNQGSRTFNAKELPDKTQGGLAAQTIMSASAPVNADAINVCYKISVPGTQPAGYYYNVVKYTATATF